jgi:hypothetical protein
MKVQILRRECIYNGTGVPFVVTMLFCPFLFNFGMAFDIQTLLRFDSVRQSSLLTDERG